MIIKKLECITCGKQIINCPEDCFNHFKGDIIICVECGEIFKWGNKIDKRIKNLYLLMNEFYSIIMDLKNENNVTNTQITKKLKFIKKINFFHFK